MLEDCSILHGSFGHLLLAYSGRSVATHAHDEFQCAFHMGGGSVIYRIGERRYNLVEGDAVFLNPWTPHSRDMEPDNPALLLTLSVKHSFAVQNLHRGRSDQIGFGCHFAQVSEQMHSALCELCQLLREGGHRALGGNRRGVLRLIHMVFAQYGCHGDPDRGISAPFRVDPRIDTACAFIKERAIGRVTLKEIASVAGLSRTQLYRRFRSYTGLSPVDAVNLFRIGWAKDMLISNDQPISEISDVMGFSYPTHFARFFLSHTGVRPREYRRRLQMIPEGRLR